MPLPRRTTRQARAQRQARVHNISSPIGGWNARDSLDRMPETDAVVLDNWFPDEGEVRLRPGYTEHATGLGDDVELLAEYHAGATRKFLAAANGSIWDVTSTGTASNLASGFSSNRWQWLNFNGRMGLVNGTDTPQEFAGSALSTLSLTASAVGTVASFIGLAAHQNRTYFWPDNSQDFYYSAVNALGGSLTRFPLSRVSQFGGNLLTMASWSRDGGDGLDDLAVFVMTSGDVIIYQGSNPGDADNWSLVGVFRIARPIAIRGAVDFGGDVVIATDQGYFPLSQAIRGRVSPNSAISDKISGAVRSAARDYGGNYGWQAIYYPQAHWLIFNVPVTTNATYVQHVMNTVTGSWCRFTDMNARCWGLYNGDLYFGGDGVVYKADDGASDDGDDIEAIARPAHNYLGSRGRRKALSAIQPIVSTEGTLNFQINVGVDFREPSEEAPTRSILTTGAFWDTAEWDTASWTGSLFVENEWRAIPGIGYVFGVRFAIRTNNIKVQWYSNNFMYKSAGII